MRVCGRVQTVAVPTVALARWLVQSPVARCHKNCIAMLTRLRMLAVHTQRADNRCVVVHCTRRYDYAVRHKHEIARIPTIVCATLPPAIRNGFFGIQCNHTGAQLTSCRANGRVLGQIGGELRLRLDRWPEPRLVLNEPSESNRQKDG